MLDVEGSPAFAIANIPIDIGMIDMLRINTYAEELGLAGLPKSSTSSVTRQRGWETV
jgi:hypothetical protein